MPGKKRKKKNASKASTSKPANKAGKKEMQQKDGRSSDTGRNLPGAVNKISGDRKNMDRDLDFAIGGEQNSKIDEMMNEKTEVLGFGNMDEMDFDAENGREDERTVPGSKEKPDAGQKTGGPDDANFSIDPALFLDFDLDGMGIATNGSGRIHETRGSNDPNDLDELDELDGIEPFSLALDEDFSADADGETMVLDLDPHGEPEDFHALLPREDHQASDDINAEKILLSSDSDRRSHESEKSGTFLPDMDMEGLGDSDNDGLLDLFLDLDQINNHGEPNSVKLPEDDDLNLEIEDLDFVADDEDLERLPAEFQDLEKELEAMGSLHEEGDFLELNLGMDDPEGEASPEGAGLGLNENLLLELDLDFEDEQDGEWVEPAGKELASPGRANPKEETRDNPGEDPDEDFLLDLDLDKDDDTHGKETIIFDQASERLDDLPSDDPTSEDTQNEGDLGLTGELLLDLDMDDMDDNEEPAEIERISAIDLPASELSATGPLPTEDDALALTIDLDEDDGMIDSDDAASAPAAHDAVELDLDAAELSISDASSTPAIAPADAEDAEDPFSLHLELEDETDGPEMISEITPEDGDASPDAVPDSKDTSPLHLDLDLDLEDEELALDNEDSALVLDDESVPVLALETMAENLDGSENAASDSEGGFTLELDLDDIGIEPESSKPALSEENAEAVDEAPDTHSLKETAADDQDPDAASEDEFLFNMDLEKFEDAPDELESAELESASPMTAKAEGVDAAGREPTEFKSKIIDEPESFEVVEEILLSSDKEAKIRETAARDEEFIDAFDMGIPTNEFEELNENRRDKERPEKRSGGDHHGRISTHKGSADQRRLGWPALILVLLLLLGALLFAAYSFGLFEGFSVRNTVHNIPIVKEYFPISPEHVGEMVTLENTINNRLVENKLVGTLFVVTGKVKNEFPMSRSHIEMVGRLFSAGKTPAGMEKVYAGNSLTDTELTSLPPDQMKVRLNNTAGKNNRNITVHPGRILPYMIVFHHLPEKLEEVTVEVVGSRPSGV